MSRATGVRPRAARSAILPFALLACLCAGAAHAAPGRLENFDARYDTGAQKSLGLAPASPATPAAKAAEAALARRVPALRVSRDEVSGLPTQLVSLDATGVLARGTELVAAKDLALSERELGEVAARRFLERNRAIFDASSDDLDTLQLRYVTHPPGGALIAKFDQKIDGVEVFNGELAVVMSAGHDVTAVAGGITPGVGAARTALGRQNRSEADAIARAAADVTGRPLAAGELVQHGTDDAGFGLYARAADRASADADRLFDRPARARATLFALGAGAFVPAWYVEVEMNREPAPGALYGYVVSAEDGRILFRNDLVQSDSYSYRIYTDATTDLRPWDGPTGTVGTPHPTGTPNGFQAPFLTTPPLISIESLLGPTDPWLPPGATTTTGNNTDAYLDLALPNGFGAGDVRGNATSPGTFDTPYDSTQNVETDANRQAVVVGMFYLVNWQHDFWYQHGFDEASGNAQTNNYGRGGVQGDPVLAEGQDRSGTDNANMATPADGGSPRMQMFKFLAGGRLNPTRDGTFDMLIVGHEMAHYLSNRLVGNGTGLGNRQGGAMGEGWGDFNADLSIVQDTDDVIGTVWAIGGQTDLKWCSSTFVDNYYYSIRRYPYTSDMMKNPLRFKDIGPGITTYPGVLGNPCTNLTSNPSEVHNAGEVWAEILWENFVALARRHGVHEGRERIMQYVIDGMKGTPPLPQFTQARDAIVAAAKAANPSDVPLLQRAFTKRGMGHDAVSPSRLSITLAGIVEDFMPFADDFEGPDLASWSGAASPEP